MKKQHLLFLSLIMLGLISCENVKENNPSRAKHTSTHSELLYLTEHLIESTNITSPEDLSSYVHDFAAQNPELFGNDVVVFDTWEELDSELDELQQMTYVEHRDWLENRQLNSPVLNSLIIHDSVQAEVWNQFGIVFDDSQTSQTDLENIEDYVEDYETQMLEEEAFAVYDEIMGSDFADYVRVSTSPNGFILSPLGNLDEQVFCNQKKLFICEGLVYKYINNGILICPIDEYENYQRISYVEEVYALATPNLVQAYPYAGNDITFFSASGQPYMTKVNFHISVTGAWFGRERKHTTMCATNYHRNNKGQYRRVACETKIVANVGVICNGGSWDYHFRTGWCPMGGGMIYHRIQYTNCGCPRTRFSYIELNLRNKHGVIMNDIYNSNL